MLTRRLFFVIFLIGLLTAVVLGARANTPPDVADVLFQDENGNPVAEATLRLLCFGADGQTFQRELVAQTDSNGFLPAGLPLPCDHLAAMQVLHEQPAGKRPGPAYTIYAVNWTVGGDTAVAPPLAKIVTIDSQERLVLFHVLASLAWEPTNNTAVTSIAEVREGLRQMSAYLYDATEGQMALGPLQIETDGQRWLEADFRFSAANDRRPSAFVGGIVPELISYKPPENMAGQRLVFTPAGTYYGRLWDGLNALGPNGQWDEPNAFRTLGHEWAHYALFLYDEYLTPAGGVTRCVCQTLSTTGCGPAPQDASLLAYHYTASEFWQVEMHGSPAVCENTIQWAMHGRADWSVLADWHAIQGLGTDALREKLPTEGPEMGFTAVLFGREPGFSDVYLPLVEGGGGRLPTVREPQIVARLAEGLAIPEVPLPAQIYLLEGGAEQPTRILPQGTLVGDLAKQLEAGVLGETILLGARPENRVRLYAQAYTADPKAESGFELIFPNSAQRDKEILQDQDLLVEPWRWRYELDVAYETERFRPARVQVGFISHEPTLEEPPLIQLCSLDAAVGCAEKWQVKATNLLGQWRATFEPLDGMDEMPRLLVVRVQDVSGRAPYPGDVMRWVQFAGGVGPGHVDADAPLLDDVVMIGSTAVYEDEAGCTSTSFMPAGSDIALQQSLNDFLGEEYRVRGVLGQPFAIKVNKPLDLQCQSAVLNGDRNYPGGLQIKLAYDPVALDDLGVKPQDLQLLWFSRNGDELWYPTQLVSLDEDHHHLTAVVNGDGIFAVVYR